jgi:hypothetical protein
MGCIVFAWIKNSLSMCRASHEQDCCWEVGRPPYIQAKHFRIETPAMQIKPNTRAIDKQITSYR